MNNEYVLQSIAASAIFANLSNCLNDIGDAFQAKETKINKELSGNISSVVITPFCEKYGEIFVTYFKKESTIIITYESEAGEMFSRQIKNSEN